MKGKALRRTSAGELPCTECGEPADRAWHRQTAAECEASMQAREGRSCANPGEHHAYQPRPADWRRGG